MLETISEFITSSTTPDLANPLVKALNDLLADPINGFHEDSLAGINEIVENSNMSTGEKTLMLVASISSSIKKSLSAYGIRISNDYTLAARLQKVYSIVIYEELALLEDEYERLMAMDTAEEKIANYIQARAVSEISVPDILDMIESVNPDAIDIILKMRYDATVAGDSLTTDEEEDVVSPIIEDVSEDEDHVEVVTVDEVDTEAEKETPVQELSEEEVTELMKDKFIDTEEEDIDDTPEGPIDPEEEDIDDTPEGPIDPTALKASTTAEGAVVLETPHVTVQQLGVFDNSHLNTGAATTLMTKLQKMAEAPLIGSPLATDTVALGKDSIYYFNFFLGTKLDNVLTIERLGNYHLVSLAILHGLDSKDKTLAALDEYVDKAIRLSENSTVSMGECSSITNELYRGEFS